MEKRKIMLNSLLKTSKFLLLFVGLTLAQAKAWANEVDFQTVYQAALKNSISLKLSEASYDEAKANLGIANSEFLPKVGVEARREQIKSDLEDLKENTSNVYVEWNLFNGFKDYNKRKSQKTDYAISKIQKDRTQINFEWIAKAKYAHAFALQEKTDAYKNIIQSNLKNLETVKRQRSSGRLSEADYLEFQLFDAKLRQDLLKIELESANALSDLQNFSGLENITQLKTSLTPKRLDLESLDLRSKVQSGHSLLEEQKLKVESLEAAKAETSGSFLPEVNLRATRGSEGIREATADPETVVTLSARWELFSGLESVNQRRKAVAQLSKAEVQYQSDKVQLINRAEQLGKQINNIIERLRFEDGNKKNVEKFLATVEGEYRRGVKNSSDLKSTLELILTTGVNASDLKADYFVSRAELQEILGEVVPEK